MGELRISLKYNAMPGYNIGEVCSFQSNKIQNGLFNEALIGFQLRGALMSETNLTPGGLGRRASVHSSPILAHHIHIIEYICAFGSSQVSVELLFLECSVSVLTACISRQPSIYC